eukprot:566748-Amphidinium_carterae.1
MDSALLPIEVFVCTACRGWTLPWTLSLQRCCAWLRCGLKQCSRQQSSCNEALEVLSCSLLRASA